jgi:UDP-N-acetylglucosamine diphosphorylase/glucosamine-1-phosphate N-acetyltransferase
MRVCLFEDRGVRDLEPLTLTRPVFELLCGLTALACKQSRFFATGPRGVLVRPELAAVYRSHAADVPVNDLSWLRAAPTLLINGRWLPPPLVAPLTATGLPGPCVGLVGDEVAYALVEPDQLADCAANTIDDCVANWKAALPHRAAGGRLFCHLWEIVGHNGEQIFADWQAGLAVHPVSPPPAGITVVGTADLLVIDPSARIDPHVVADTTNGPVVVDREAQVLPFTRLEGPCYIGPRTQIHGAKIRAGTSLGPECRIGGEVEASIVQGYSNKYHDGFLGHAYVGEWVNLGAGTYNSDLRNDYGAVRVMVDGRLVCTGQTKVGCFLGDHTKAGLGTLLDTGTNAGVFCGLLPGGLLPKYIPSFAGCRNGVLTDRTDLAEHLRTAAEVMRRRGQTLTEAQAVLYRGLYEQTAAERRRVLREAEIRALRRSA